MQQNPSQPPASDDSSDQERITRVISIADTALDVSEPYLKRVDAAKQLLDMQIAHLVKLGEHYQDPDNVKDMEEFVKSFTRGFVSVARAEDKGSAFVDVVKRIVEETE